MTEWKANALPTAHLMSHCRPEDVIPSSWGLWALKPHGASRLRCKPFKPGLFLHKWESNLCWPQECGGKCRCSDSCERCYLLGKEARSFLLHQFSSVIQSCLIFCDPTDCSTPGFPVHHQLLELAQTHVHQVSDAIQPSHPLSYPSPHAFYLAQHQGLFPWVGPLHQVAKVLEFQLQHQSF